MSEFYSPLPEGYELGQTKYVVVLGTVMSGLGKGIFIGSLARVLQDRGLSVAPIKLEGYLNLDSGTLSPYRHGEVFVLDDGTECDMDLGNYERMLNIDMSRLNFATFGQIFSSVLARERRGDYLGRDVQMVPHCTGEIKLRLRELALESKADVVFVEIGGTVGDLENGPYIEACRQLAAEEGDGNVCFVALTYIPFPKSLGEQKSKPAQLGLRQLMSCGILPHIIACRSRAAVSQTVREKIAMFVGVPLERVFSMHDVSSVCLIPDMIREDGLDRVVLDVLGMKPRAEPHTKNDAYASMYMNAHRSTKRAKIGITGKYTALRDAYASIIHAVEHAAAACGVDADIHWIDTGDLDDENTGMRMAKERVDGVIVPGGFGTRGAEGKIACIRYVRELKIPFLGICYGFQLATVEFARNRCDLPGATTGEIDPEADHKVIDILPGQADDCMGGTMRLGGHDISLCPDSKAAVLYRSDRIRLRFRHRYELVSDYVDVLEEKGMLFSGTATDGSGVKQILELQDHPFFLATQGHPELTSRPSYPDPMFKGFMSAVAQRIK